MSQITTFVPPSSGWLAAAGRRALQALRALASLARAVRNRREVMHLLELDDRALKDIGLVRNDVAGALDAPLTRDPSVLLRLRSVERRARARRLPLRVTPPMTARAGADPCGA